MLIRIPRGWEIKESQVTPEAVFLNRRALVAGALAAGSGIAAPAFAQAKDEDPSAGLYPLKRNEAFQVDRPLTDEATASTYNNFYEFGSHKQIWRAAQKLPIRPWTVRIDGLVEKPFEIAIDDLLKRMPLEERHYRFRCVEAWSMTVPWGGFPMKALVELARPLSAAKYVAMDTFHNPEIASGQKASWYPWPYREGVTIEEAANELTFLVTGVYGKPARKQYGAPLRLALPWKYGFKSVKSIVRFEFTDKRPVSFWEKLQPAEYGFWANVNPQVSHPRWSQATEEVIGTGKRVPTLLFNGYGEFVAKLYDGIKGEKLFV
ncbi:MAG: protein-methionine-sulfoxide reductase catalytic subunit MsrP [Alphaproteobacteria bacterium]|nr:protein-methionine-sulfoxide reductase catalytic subunit MsrP [Alphaproteobacteria bacterium]